MVTTRSQRGSSHQEVRAKKTATIQSPAKSVKQPQKSGEKLASKQTTATEETRLRDITSTMHSLLASRAATSTICPSDIPRRLHSDNQARYPDWRAMMHEVRDIVWQAVDRGEVEVTQGGEVRTLEERDQIKGPIRVKKGPRWPGLQVGKTDG